MYVTGAGRWGVCCVHRLSLELETLGKMSGGWFLFLASCLALGAVRGSLLPSRQVDVPYEFYHHDHEAMYDLMSSYASEFPHIAHLYSVGQSENGAELWAVVISDDPTVHEPGEPEVKYVANMHGNEVTGRETLLYLMQYLCELYATDEAVRELVDSTRIHLLPTMNPDGYAVAFEGDSGGVTGRVNANGYDLNRNFPDRFGRSTVPVQPETQAVIAWIHAHPFVLSANFHNGALVASYPYDNTEGGRSVYSKSPDDDIFIHLAKAYSFSHSTMHLGVVCGGEGFTDGITNGANWYNIDGGMQDYNYVNSDCFEVTIEQGCFKFPFAEELPGIWTANRAAMLAFIREAHRGVAGFVTDDRGDPISGARVDVVGRNRLVTTTELGEFWRLLTPGVYSIAVSADGYSSVCQDWVEVPNEGKVNLNFTLSRASLQDEYEFTCSSPDSVAVPSTIPSMVAISLLFVFSFL